MPIQRRMMESRPENAREEVFATSSTRRSLFTPGGPPARAVIGSDADRTVRLKTGIVLPYNPNTAANNNKIVEDCFKRCLVKGRATEGRASKGQSSGTRHSGLYVTDVGAQPDRATCDPRAVLLCGGGHEEATYIRNISPLTHLMVGGGLADIIDCVSEGALKMLRDSSDLHKAWQWQEMLRTVVVRCFSLEYIVQVCCACAASLRKSQVACMLQETSAELTLEGFHRFLKENSEKDVTFAVMSELFVTDIMPALRCQRRALRVNNARAHAAARKALLRLIAARNAPKYLAALVLEIIDIEFRAPPEIRRLIEKYRSYRGQGCVHVPVNVTGSSISGMAILHGRPYCTGDPIARAAILHGRPYCTGGPIARAAILQYRTGGHIAWAAILHGRPYCTGGHIAQVGLQAERAQQGHEEGAEWSELEWMEGSCASYASCADP